MASELCIKRYTVEVVKLYNGPVCSHFCTQIALVYSNLSFMHDSLRVSTLTFVWLENLPVRFMLAFMTVLRASIHIVCYVLVRLRVQRSIV